MRRLRHSGGRSQFISACSGRRQRCREGNELLRPGGPAQRQRSRSNRLAAQWLRAWRLGRFRRRRRRRIRSSHVRWQPWPIGLRLPELAAAAAATRAPAVLIGPAETGAEGGAATTAPAAAARAVCPGKVRKAAPAAVVVVDLRTLKVRDTCWKTFEEGRLLAMVRSLSPGKERIRRKFKRLSVIMCTPA